MNYEQKYKEALGWMQSLYKGLHGATKEDAEHYFPELKEDEDEKMKREILELVSIAGNGNQFEEIKDWLEKQGEQKPIKASYTTIIETGDGGINALVKRDLFTDGCYGEKNSSNKVGPKFKVGDWVILNGIVAKILDKQKYGFVGLDIDGKDFFCNYGHTDSMRLWTINDVKDGDVLVNGSNIFIFHFINGTRLMGCCHVNIDDGKFYNDLGKNECFCLIDAIVTPSTKEQRDLLFQKMKEAGYEWDAEKKELKKIEPKMLDADKVIEWFRVNWWDNHIGDPIDKFKQNFGL